MMRVPKATSFRLLASPKAMQGVGLIEVLIAVLIMAIGMLGIAALQATSLRNSQSSLERSNAVIQSYAIFDAMRANLPGVKTGDYNLAAMQCEALADPDTLSKKDINRWVNSLHEMLGDADTTCGQIVCSDEGVCTVTVQWDDSRGTRGEEAQEMTTVAHL